MAKHYLSELMPSTEKVTNIPGLPTSIKTRIYTLFYRQGTMMAEKHFPFDGDLRAAIDRGRDHCTRMNYRFIQVRPFIVDLEHQEKMKLDSRENSMEYYGDDPNVA